MEMNRQRGGKMQGMKGMTMPPQHTHQTLGTDLVFSAILLAAAAIMAVAIRLFVGIARKETHRH